MQLEQIKKAARADLEEWRKGKGSAPPDRRFDPLKFERESSSKFTATDLYDLIKREAVRRKENLARVRRTWIRALGAFYLQQWIQWDPKSQRLRDLAKVAGFSYNSPHLFDSGRHQITLQVKNPPRIGFLPATGKPGALESCRAANVLLPHLDRVNETSRQEGSVHAPEVTTIGTTIANVYLDERSQKVFTSPKKEKRLKIASHRWTDPWNFFPNEEATGLRPGEGCRNVIRVDRLHVDEIHDLYDIWVEPEKGLYEEPRPNPFDSADTTSMGRPLLLEEHAEVFTCETAGSKEAENGRQIVAVGGRVPIYREGELENGRVPYTIWRYMSVPGEIWGLPYALPALPILREINAIMTKMLGAVYKSLTEWWGRRSDSPVSAEFFQRAAYRMFTYTNELPKNLAKEINAQVEQYMPVLERLYRDLDNALAYHDISRGGDRTLDTATQAEISQQNDAESLTATFSERELAYIDLAEMRMELQQRRGSDELQYLAFGQAQPWDMAVWKKTEFENQLVAVAWPDSGKPRTAAAKVRLLNELIKMKVIDEEMFKDISVKEAIMGFFEGIPVEGLFDKAERNRSRAQNENLLLMKGVPVPVEVGELHRVHIGVHEALKDNPDVRKAISQKAAVEIHAHIAMHYLMDVEVLRADRQGLIPLELLQPGQELAYPHGRASILQDELKRMVRARVLDEYGGMLQRFFTMPTGEFLEEEFMAAVDRQVGEELGEPAPTTDVAEEEQQFERARREIVTAAP